MTKKLTAFLLSIVMCMSLLSMMVSADYIGYYDLWVNGERFTTANTTIKCGDGEAIFDSGKNVLLLHNATITNTFEKDGVAAGIYSKIDFQMEGPFTIRVEGTITIDLSQADINSQTDICGIYYDPSYKDSLLVYGDGSVTIDAGTNHSNSTYSFFCQGGLSILGTDLDCATCTGGIKANDDLIVLPPHRIVSSSQGSALDVQTLNFDICDDSYRVFVADNPTGLNAVEWDESEPISHYSYVSIELDDYPVWVNGEQFTSNKKTINCGGGTATYNPDTKKLTLNNTEITKGAIISTSKIDIELEGKNIIDVDDVDDSGYYGHNGIYSCLDINISGTGELEISGCIIGIYSCFGAVNIDILGNLTINGCAHGIIGNDLSLKANGNIDINVIETGITTNEDINLSGDGNITISAVEYYGISLLFGNVIISGTGEIKISSQNGRAADAYYSDILLNGDNCEISFMSDNDKCLSYCTVGGTNLSKYDVTGAPDTNSLKYTLRTYNVTFDINGHGTAPENQTVPEDAAPKTPSNPTAAGYLFKGWYADRACTKEFDFDIAYNVDTTAFAKWAECPHTHSENRNAKASTLTSKGYTGDTYCTDCGAKLTDGKAIPTLSPEPTNGATPTSEPTPGSNPGNNPTPSTNPNNNSGNNPTPSTNPGNNPNSNSNSPAGEPTAAPELNVGDFINRCYEVALGRKADEEGYEYWVSSLNNGEACGAQVGFGFIFSEEYINKNRTNEEFVNDMYAMYFGREADEGGFNYWVEQLNSGTATREDIMAGFANSEEFFNLCGKYGVVCGAYIVGVPNEQQGGVNCFVARLYKVCLNRLPDQVGQAGWVQKLMNGEVTGSSCSYGFVFSEEFINLNLDNTNYVKYMYNAFFGREADEEGLTYWVNQLNAGTATREDVFNGFTGSPEFINLCASYGINA